MLHKKTLTFPFIFVLIWLSGLITVVQEYNVISVTKGLITDATVRGGDLVHTDLTPKLLLSGNSVWQNMGPSQAEKAYELTDILVSRDVPPGNLGRPVVLKKNLKGSVRALVKLGWEEHVFNKFVSDIIPLNRSLLDPRDRWCLAKNRFLKDLPRASVVICFHNEALSALLRTVHSVINRSPEHLLQEIILVDDYSYMTDLKTKLEDRLKALPKVRLIRAKQREGIARSRIIGVKEAAAPVIIFLDSHCECAEGWLIPLLDRIAMNYTNVASPVVDVIEENTFQYQALDSLELQIGGFTWSLNYIWRYIPAKYMCGRKSPSAPIQTPIISGGLFAISKRFFQELGYYDAGLKIWGGDNFDISFKVWMCGGTLEIVPCSHVGHVFRKYMPYHVPFQLYVRNNLARIAEVWLNDTAKFFYERIGSTKADVGDILAQKALRLKCKPFSWYLANVYPELVLPDQHIAGGKLVNMAYSNMCMDAASRQHTGSEHLRLLPCHHEGGNQYWDYTKDGHLKRDNFCLNVVFDRVILFPCWDVSAPTLNNPCPVWTKHDAITARASQIWMHEPKAGYIKHLSTLKCLEAKNTRAGLVLILASCMPGSKDQNWTMERYNASNVSPELKRAMMLNS